MFSSPSQPVHPSSSSPTVDDRCDNATQPKGAEKPLTFNNNNSVAMISVPDLLDECVQEAEVIMAKMYPLPLSSSSSSVSSSLSSSDDEDESSGNNKLVVALAIRKTEMVQQIYLKKLELWQNLQLQREQMEWQQRQNDADRQQRQEHHEEHMDVQQQNHGRNTDCDLVKMQNAFWQARSSLTGLWVVTLWLELGFCVAYAFYGEPDKDITVLGSEILDGIFTVMIGTCPDPTPTLPEIEPVDVADPATETWMSYFYSYMSVSSTVEAVEEVILKPVSNMLFCGGYYLKHLGIVLVAVVFFFFMVGPHLGGGVAYKFLVGLTVVAWLVVSDIAWTAPYLVFVIAAGVASVAYLYRVFYRIERELLGSIEPCDSQSLYAKKRELDIVVRNSFLIAVSCVLAYSGALVYEAYRN